MYTICTMNPISTDWSKRPPRHPLPPKAASIPVPTPPISTFCSPIPKKVEPLIVNKLENAVAIVERAQIVLKCKSACQKLYNSKASLSDKRALLLRNLKPTIVYLNDLLVELSDEGRSALSPIFDEAGLDEAAKSEIVVAVLKMLATTYLEEPDLANLGDINRLRFYLDGR